MGSQTFIFSEAPVILASAAVAGPKEGQGPLNHYFDFVLEDTLFGEKAWEKSECKMLQEAIRFTVAKAGLSHADIDFLLAGDLLNQNISANYAARDLRIPFLGLYGACSTMAESLILGAVLVDGYFASRTIAAVSSHYNTAERQYRFPNELGVQRSPTAQQTVTGAGAVLIGKGSGPRITHATVGIVIDMGVKDPQNLGAAMAPAAADTIIRHFKDTNRTEKDYDLIITGDLAILGKTLAEQIMEKQGYYLRDKYTDCGILIFDPSQDTHSGGSGCACSAIVLCGYLMENLKSGNLKRILFVGTGALMSPISLQQGESIAGIAHAVAIENN